MPPSFLSALRHAPPVQALSLSVRLLLSMDFWATVTIQMLLILMPLAFMPVRLRPALCHTSATVAGTSLDACRR